MTRCSNIVADEVEGVLRSRSVQQRPATIRSGRSPVKPETNRNATDRCAAQSPSLPTLKATGTLRLYCVAPGLTTLVAYGNAQTKCWCGFRDLMRHRAEYFLPRAMSLKWL